MVVFLRKESICHLLQINLHNYINFSTVRKLISFFAYKNDFICFLSFLGSRMADEIVSMEKFSSFGLCWEFFIIVTSRYVKVTFPNLSRCVLLCAA